MSTEIAENQLTEDQTNIHHILNICFFDSETDLMLEDLEILRELLLKSNFSDQDKALLLASIDIRSKEISWETIGDEIHYYSDEHFITYFLDFFRVEYSVGFSWDRKGICIAGELISNLENEKVNK